MYQTCSFSCHQEENSREDGQIHIRKNQEEIDCKFECAGMFMNLVAKILCYCVSTNGIHITTVILFALIVEAQDLSDQAIVLCSEKLIVNQLTALYQQIDNVWQHTVDRYRR